MCAKRCLVKLLLALLLGWKRYALASSGLLVLNLNCGNSMVAIGSRSGYVLVMKFS